MTSDPATTAVRVDLGSRGYDVHITSGDSSGLGAFARSRAAGRLAFVVSDEHVSVHAESAADALAAAGFRPVLSMLPSGERQKSLAVAAHLYDNLAELGADRTTLVVAVGGGVIGDLAGFAAATFMRGLPLLMVPTTLLAMVDSSVGGKVGVNHTRAKNLIGAFHQPLGVWIDTATLSTLPEREYRSGLAEVVKYGVIADAELFAYLEGQAAAILEREATAIRHLVSRSCRIKADIVQRDEHERTGLRALLNYGHTFGHAFETVGGYGSWLHGEAVSAGMACAAQLAVRRGLLCAESVARQQKLLTAFGLPTRPEQWPADRLLAAMASDKKAVGGRLRFILPTKLGAAAVYDDVTHAEVVVALADAAAG